MCGWLTEHTVLGFPVARLRDDRFGVHLDGRALKALPRILPRLHLVHKWASLAARALALAAAGVSAHHAWECGVLEVVVPNVPFAALGADAAQGASTGSVIVVGVDDYRAGLAARRHAFFERLDAVDFGNLGITVGHDGRV